MPNVIIFGDSRHPSLRHEVPVPLPDPIGYLESRRARGRSSPARSTFLACRRSGGYEVVSFEELGLNELLAEGKRSRGRFRGCVVRACRQARRRRGRRAGRLPARARRRAPAGAASRLDGGRRRVRSAPAREERRPARGHPSRAGGGGGARWRTSATALRERRRADRRGAARGGARRIFVENGCVPHDMLVIAAGAHGADPHDQGTGPIPAGVPIVVDIFPRDIGLGLLGRHHAYVLRRRAP